MIVMPSRQPTIQGSTGGCAGVSCAGMEPVTEELSDGTAAPPVDSVGSNSEAGVLSLAGGIEPGTDSVAGGATGVVVAGGLAEGFVDDCAGFVVGCVGLVAGFVAEGSIT